MIVPTVHMNGTSKQSLTDGYEAAYNALNVAYEAVKQTAPNGRDYYLQGNEAFGIAADEHVDRLRAVEKLMNDFESLITYVNTNRDGIHPR